MSGTNDKFNALKSSQYDLSGLENPTISAVAAAIGSTYRMVGADGGRFFIKLDDGLTTNWFEAGAGSISPAVFNALFDLRFATKSTSDLAEGLNLYFTIERARLAVPEWVDGVPYSYDLSRAKKISLNRNTYSFYWDSPIVSNRYLKFQNIPSMSDNGILIPKNSVILGIYAQSKSLGNWTAQIRRNNLNAPIHSLVVSNGKAKDMNLNIDIVEDTVIQIYAQGTIIKNPMVHIELAYKL